MSLTPFSFVFGVGCPINTVNVILDGFAGPGPNEFNVRAEADILAPTNLTVSDWDYEVNDSGVWVNMTTNLVISSGTLVSGYEAVNHGSTVASVKFRINTGTPTSSGAYTINYT
jgi:hypothetical protein